MISHYHHDGTIDALECPACKQDLALGRHDALNGRDERGIKDHTQAYWAGYREGLLQRRIDRGPVNEMYRGWRPNE